MKLYLGITYFFTFTFVVAIILFSWFSFTTIVSAQSCSGSGIQCCGSQQTTCGPAGCQQGSCPPWQPNCTICTCSTSCTSQATISCVPLPSQGICAPSQNPEDGLCVFGTISGSCGSYVPPSSGGGSTPTPAPTGGGSSTPAPTPQPGYGSCGSCSPCNGGEAFNACVTTPSGGCEWDAGRCGSGGSESSACSIRNMAPQEVRVGEVVAVTVEGNNGRSSYRDSYVRINNIDTGLNNKIWVTNTFADMQNAIANPSYIQPSTVNKNICCGAGGNDSNPRYWTFYFRGTEIGWDTVEVEYRVEQIEGSNRNTCTKNYTFRVTSPPAWAQVLNGDLMTFGRIVVPIPTGQFLIGRGSSDEGIATYNPNTTVPSTSFSQRGWNVNGSQIPSPLTYSTLFEQIPTTATVTSINGAITSQSLNPFPSRTDSLGYEWFVYNGNNAIIPNNITIPSGKKIVLFVPGNVTINGNITMTNPSNSFFMLISSGNISINNPVGRNATDATPNIEGIYVSDGMFMTSSGSGPNNNRVNVRGTVVALGGVSLLRDNQAESPSETFTFAPEMLINFPPSMSIKRAFWKEVAP